MNEERKIEEFETDTKKWKIYFDIEVDKMRGRGDRNIVVSFISKEDSGYLKKEDLEELKQDLKDLGKLRIIKQGRKFLEE